MAQREQGFVYKVSPKQDKDVKKLLTARVKSSCQEASGGDSASSVFSSSFQYFYPYRGQIDGFETIDVLRPEGQLLEYNMGSAHAEANARSCDAASANADTSDLFKTACSIAQGEAPAGVSVTLGCFREKAAGNQFELVFQK